MLCKLTLHNLAGTHCLAAGYPAAQGYPPSQGYPPAQGYPPQAGAYPAQGYPPQQQPGGFKCRAGRNVLCTVHCGVVLGRPSRHP
jgi:hypothetical protein